MSSELDNMCGRIKSVNCKDFVTYDECMFYPTKYLNLIIGPNGTGKSTLLAAIVIGLGGNPKILSRATCIQDYVKNGKEKCEIIVEIFCNESGNTIFFKRKFDLHGKSEFWIDDQHVVTKKFLQTISTYNIQINNLCQFLPQDRVQDFAKMNPQEILNNTINSVCNQEIQEKFTNLKDLRKQQLLVKKNLPRDMQKYKEYVSRNEDLRAIIDKMNAKKQLEQQLVVCKAKKAWKEIEEFQKSIQDNTNDVNAIQKLVDIKKKAHSDIMKKQSSVIAKTNELKNEINCNAQKVSSILAKIDNITDECDRIEQNINKLKHEFETDKRDLAERADELKNELTILEALAKDIKNATVPDTQDDLQQLEIKFNRLKIEISSLISKRSDINKQIDDENDKAMPLKSRIERLENIKEKKLQFLKNKHADVYQALLWLRQNTNEFEAKVYEPRILELNIPDTNDAKYFENTIPLRDLMAFTCESKSDMTKFIRIMSTEKNLKINVQYSKPAKECIYKPNDDISYYRKYGFRDYLINLIEGPPAILNSICSLFHLERILVGSDEVSKHVDNIPQNIRLYYGGDLKYSVTISKYSGQSSVMQTVIKDKQLLSSIDKKELNHLKDQLNKRLRSVDILKNERTTIEVKARSLELQRTDIMKEQRAIEAKTAQLKHLKEQCKQQARKVEQLKQHLLNAPKLEEIFQNNAKNEVHKLIQLKQTKVNTLNEYQKAIAKKKYSTCFFQVHKIENENVTRLVTEVTEAYETLLKQKNVVLNCLENKKKNCILKENEAKDLTKGFHPNDRKFPYRKEFNELSNNIEEIISTMNDITGRLECLIDADQDVLTEYEKRSADIEALKKSIENTRNLEEKLENEIKNIYTQWFNEVQRIIDDINHHFSSFMKSMGYAGEVILSKKEDYDFDSYGIQIMVQYRNNVDLQTLDRHVQSGGERAVAIAVYSLSLQHLTIVPFRCVDEINQGMDPINERKVFEMLVEETCKEGSSQYFFITPKLLPNLKSNDKMSVHIVFNGAVVAKDVFKF